MMQRRRRTPVYRRRCHELIAAAIARDGGWLPFDRFMALALYAPGLGYYARDSRKFGAHAGVGQRLRHRARAVAAVRPRAGAPGRAGAGRPAAATRSGSSAPAPARWPRSCSTRSATRSSATRSSTCRARCASASASGWPRIGDRCGGSTRCPMRSHGVVVGNEVLDAMPVQLLHCDGAAWLERGVVARRATRFAWADRPTALRPPLDAAVRARHRDRDPPAGRGLHRDAGRPAASAAPPSSSTTAFPRPSTTTRSAAAAP